MTAPDKPDAVVTEEELDLLKPTVLRELMWAGDRNCFERLIASYRALREENAKLRKDLNSLGVMAEDSLVEGDRLRIELDKLRAVADAALAYRRHVHADPYCLDAFEQNSCCGDEESKIDDALAAAGYYLNGKELL